MSQLSRTGVSLEEDLLQEFDRLLANAGVQLADGDSVLTAAVVAVPRSLRGETREEGMLAALAQELGHNRRRFDVDEEDDLALSVNFRHDGGNDFECDLAASEDYNMTVWIGRGSDDERVRAILARDLGALEGLISYFDTDWIENYVSEDDEMLVQGKQVFSPGIVVDGVYVDVWPGAIRYTRFHSVGTVAETQVTAIDRTVFDQIEQALDALRNGWFHNAHAVLAIREIVPLD